MNKTVKVFSPASVANVAVGYDMLGFALENIGDDILVRQGNQKGLIISKIHKNKQLSKNLEENTAGYGALQLLKSLGLEDEPIEMELFKNMEVGTGLGSSAASAVGGVFAVNEYLGRPYSKKQLLLFATQAEQIADGSYHADNVAPCMMGSMILVRDNATLDCIKLPIPIGLRAVVIFPKIKILTKDSRSVLSETVGLQKHIEQSSNLGGFIAGMYTSDFDLIQRSMEDVVIESQRASLIPGFYEIKNQALNLGALGCSISGAGPSIFCLCNNSLVAENIQNAWNKEYSDRGIEYTSWISNINREGVKCY